MTKYFSKTGRILFALILPLLFSSTANAFGKLYLDQTRLNAIEIKVKMNMFKTGGTITLQGCAEGCPSGLSANKKTIFTVNGKEIKRKEIKHYSGRSGFLSFYKATKSVTHIDWQ